MLTLAIGSDVSAQDLAYVAAEFERAPGFVNYRDFSIAVVDVDVSVSAEFVVQTVLGHVRKAYRVQGIDVKAYYEKFDPRHSGKVAVSQVPTSQHPIHVLNAITCAVHSRLSGASHCHTRPGGAAVSQVPHHPGRRRLHQGESCMHDARPVW